MIESEERIVDVVLVVDGEGIKPELDRRSSPVWVIPILLHLANLVTNCLTVIPSIHQMTPACLALLPVGLRNRTAGHHPIRIVNFTIIFWVQSLAEKPAGETSVLSSCQRTPEECSAGETGGGRIEAVPKLQQFAA